MADEIKQHTATVSADENTEDTSPKSKDKVKENPAQKSKDKNKGKKRKEPGKVRRWFKDFFSELKKVTWPSFMQVLKQTGTVLLVTVCFLLVVLAFDSLLGYLYTQLLSGLSTESVLLSVFGGGGGLL